MNAAEHALSLMAEAAAHGVTILYSHRDIGISFMGKRGTWETGPTELLEELEAHANEIWAILHSYRTRANA